MPVLKVQDVKKKYGSNRSIRRMIQPFYWLPMMLSQLAFASELYLSRMVHCSWRFSPMEIGKSSLIGY
jgi:hypothetical protein